MTTAEESLSAIARLVETRDPAAIAEFGQSLEHEGHLPPRVAMAVAKALADCNDVPRALAWYERIPPSEKAYAFSRAQMARLLNAARQFERALEVTETFADHDAPDPICVARMRALIGLNRHADALAFARRLESGEGLSAPLQEAAADAASSSGDWEQALGFLDRAVAGSGDTRLRLRRAFALFQVGRLDECQAALAELLANEAFFVRAQQILIRVLQRTRDSERLVAECRVLLAVEPANELAHDALVKHYIDIQDFALARQAFEAAKTQHPERYPLQLINFLVLERQGRLRLALKEFLPLDLHPALGDEFKERIGTAFYLSGQYERAERVAKLIADDDRRALLACKIALARGQIPDAASLPSGRDGRLAEALILYQKGRFDESIERLDTLGLDLDGALAVGNLANLARSRRVLPTRLYGEAQGAPHWDGPLPVIQLLWVGNALSRLERLSIRSFVACGHEVHLYTYDAAAHAPSGCRIMDARDILPESAIFAHSGRTGRSAGSLAGFADLFRWKLIYEKGGAWADCDVICLRPIRAERIVSTEFARMGNFVTPAVTNCFFAAPPGEQAFGEAFEQAQRSDRDALRWGEIGIHKMSDIVAREQWGDRLTPPSDLCPIPSFRIIDAIFGKTDVEEIIEETRCRAVHVYNEVMRMVGFDKDGAYPRKGLLGVLEDRVMRLEREGAPG